MNCWISCFKNHNRKEISLSLGRLVLSNQLSFIIASLSQYILHDNNIVLNDCIHIHTCTADIYSTVGNWNELPAGPTKSHVYDGQLWLLPPNTTSPERQVSFGQVYINIAKEWAYINQTVPLSSYAADSLCIQLGYTQADPHSITTPKQLTSVTFDR